MKSILRLSVTRAEAPHLAIASEGIAHMNVQTLDTGVYFVNKYVLRKCRFTGKGSFDVSIAIVLIEDDVGIHLLFCFPIAKDTPRNEHVIKRHQRRHQISSNDVKHVMQRHQMSTSSI